MKNLSIDKHSVKIGQLVWTFIGGIPAQIYFHGLRSYSGFFYIVSAEIGLQESNYLDETIFAETRENLINFKIDKIRQEISEKQAEESKYLAMLDLCKNSL